MDLSDLTLLLTSKGLISEDQKTAKAKPKGDTKKDTRSKGGKSSLEMAQRVLVLAIDSSEHSEYAFDCEYFQTM